MSPLDFTTAAGARSAIDLAVPHLRAGGALAYPTETVYGLGSVVRSEPMELVRAMKGREEGKPFLLLVSDLEMLLPLGLQMPSDARSLAEAFWPGALTLVLPGGNSLPDRVRGETGGVAVRLTGHSHLRQLIAALGEPLTSTSANLAGSQPFTRAADVTAAWPREFSTGRLLVLDGGGLAPSLPSTVVDCTCAPPRILRAGAVTSELLRGTLGESLELDE